MGKRRCDGCTVCCFVPAVPELDKPVNTWCEHCAVGTGCTIYKQRPQGCRDFTCLWLANPVIAEEARPDRCGVMFEVLHSGIVLAMVDPQRPDSWRGVEPQRIIDNLIGHGHPVVVTCKDRAPVTLVPNGVKTADVWAQIREMMAS